MRIYRLSNDLLGWLAAVVAEVGHNKAINKETMGVAVLCYVACQNLGGLVDWLGAVGLPDFETICAVSVAERFESEGIWQKSTHI